MVDTIGQEQSNVFDTNEYTWSWYTPRQSTDNITMEAMAHFASIMYIYYMYIYNYNWGTALRGAWLF